MSSLYETAFRRVLYPAYETGLRRRGTLAWLDEYERSQWLSPAQLAELQWTRLKRLLEHCYREVPYYQRQWRELGITPDDIRSLEDYARLPTLTKADIRSHGEDLKAISWRDRMLYKNTSGSTGEPLRFGYNRESNDRRTAVMFRGYGWAGAPPGRRSLVLWGGGLGNPPLTRRWKDQLYHAAFGRRLVNSFHMTEANMGTYADMIDRHKPEILLGYFGPLLKLAKWLLENGRRVHPPRAFIVNGEAMHEFEREIIEQAFGCTVYNTYGCREFMMVAGECDQHHGMHVNMDHLVVERVAPEGADLDPLTGEAIITDLFNYGMPFIRYATGDLITASTDQCPCGRGLPLISQVEGRLLDAIRTPDGRILPGMFFPFLLKEVPGVAQYQIVQRRLDRLDLNLVRGKAFNDDSLAMIHREIRKVLGDSIEVNCQFVDTIPLTRSGKTRLTISELAQ